MKFENIWKIYEDGVLRDINLSFDIKKIHIIYDEYNLGDGIFSLLGLTEDIKDGNFIFENKIIKFNNDLELSNFRRNNLGFMFNYASLDNNLSVFDNILLPLVNEKNINNKIKKEKVNKILKLLNLENYKNNYPLNLSSLDYKKVELARSLVNDPKFIIANEPTLSMDDEDETLFYKELKNIAKNGVGIIIITNKYYLKKYADKVYRVRNGFIDEVQ